MEEKEIEEQRYGRNKSTQVDLSYISSGEFRRKFDCMTDSKELNRLLYGLAKEMLQHRAGTMFEDMYWIDPATNEVVAEYTDSTVPSKIVYPKRIRKVIDHMEGLITIHSHPSGLPPSIADFNSNYSRNYSMGVVVGHNGKIYTYTSYEEISEKYFERKVAMYRQDGYNEVEARNKALLFCCEHFKISYKEVTLDD